MNQKGYSWLPILFIVGLVAILSAGYNSLELDKARKALELKVNISQTPKFTPFPTYLPPTTDPDPIVDCIFTYIGTKRLRNSVCKKSTECQIGNEWIFYSDVYKCKEDQAKYYKAANDSTSTISTKKGYSCTICFNSGNCSTYNYLYKTKEECDTAQSTYRSPSSYIPLPTALPIITTTLSSPTPKISYDDFKIWCESRINPKYDSLIRGCPNIGGDSSATRMCEYAYNQERHKELTNCLQQY